MATFLTLLCHGPTASMREGGFPIRDEPLEPANAPHFADVGDGAGEWLTSPSLAARQTAQALQVEARVDDALRDMDHGAWSGRSFADLAAAHAPAFQAWIAEPERGAPGGESFDALRVRLAGWLGERTGAPRVNAVTHPMVVRAVLAGALDLPASSALRIDVGPLTAATLSFNGVWRLQALRPAYGRPARRPRA